MPDDISCLTPYFGATLVDATFPPAASFVSDAWRHILTLPFWCHNLPCRRIFVWRHILTRQFLTPHLEKNCFGAHILGGFKWVSPYWLHRYPAACRILYIALLLSRLVSFRRELGKTLAFLPFWRRSCRASTLHYLKNLWGLFGGPCAALNQVWIRWFRIGFINFKKICRIQKTYGNSEVVRACIPVPMSEWLWWEALKSTTLSKEAQVTLNKNNCVICKNMLMKGTRWS